MTRARAALALGILAVAALAGIGLGLLAHAASGETNGSALRLPAMHGQGTWGPGERAAPSITLRDQDGRPVSLRDLRGRPVLLTFFDSRCVDQCPVAGRQLGQVLIGMPAAKRPVVVVVSVNPQDETPRSIRAAMAHWRLDGPWRWHWLRGTKRELKAVWNAYGITVEPTTHDVSHGLVLYLIDRQGYERSGYLFPFLPNFVELDLQTLAEERA